jgi:uncharacterized caspase-like protein
MAELSPAAQTMLDAVRQICPAPANEIAAAALRAAANRITDDQILDGLSGEDGEGWQLIEERNLISANLLAIAAELEAL